MRPKPKRYSKLSMRGVDNPTILKLLVQCVIDYHDTELPPSAKPTIDDLVVTMDTVLRRMDKSTNTTLALQQLLGGSEDLITLCPHTTQPLTMHYHKTPADVTLHTDTPCNERGLKYHLVPVRRYTTADKGRR